MINAPRLAQLRVNHGLSQRKLAYLVGVNYQVIRRIESGGDDGNLTLRHLQRLCEALQTDPQALLSAAPEASKPQVHGIQDELSLSQARLLRRIQRGTDIRRELGAPDRDFVLPSLATRGLVTVGGGEPIRLSPQANEDLSP